jgi:phage virion morphogenesis protein
MTGVDIQIQAPEVSMALMRLQARILNPRSMMASISAELLSLTEKAFQNEGSPDKWKSLASSTIRNRTKKGTWPGKILQVSTAGLAASVTPTHGDHFAGISAGAGKSAKYAMIQQFGGKAGKALKATIPARGYLPVRKSGSDFSLTPQAERSIMSLTSQFFGTAL